MTNSPYTNSPPNVSFETNFNVSFETNFTAGQATSAAQTKQIVIKEIRAKWASSPRMKPLDKRLYSLIVTDFHRLSLASLPAHPSTPSFPTTR